MVRVEGGGMPEGRDPAIKLFGRKIPLQEEQSTAEGGAVEDFAPAMEPLKEAAKDSSKENSTTEANPTLDAEPDSNQKESLSCSPSEISKEAEEPKPEHDSNRETSSTSAGEDKVAAAAALKKPDKVLQCPRCNSMDTKFCYYNNYNVNQPRHFCKNCQRYWTAGGTMRNVPVGAGRRKNKNASPAFRHMVVTPDTLASAQLDCPDPLMKTPLKANSGTILKFGPDAPLCESMTSVLNLGENREEPSCSSSVTASEAEQMGCQNEPHLQQCYPLPPPWAYAWNPMVAAPPPFCAAPALPFPFIPASFWTCMPWSFPLMGTNNGSSCEPILGKHHRDSDASAAAEEEKAEKSLWVPKTLRIDDIDEAAKSSIFATLGIKPDGYKGFPSKPQKLLRANPAALSRSQSFQETTTT